MEDVVFPRKADVGATLDRPLDLTLRTPAPFVSGRIMPDAGVVDRFTAERIFKVTFQQIPDGTALVVLSRARFLDPSAELASRPGNRSAGSRYLP